MSRQARVLVTIPLVIISIMIIGSLLMFLLHLCPPTGPWPTPPWCEDKEIKNTNTLNDTPLSYLTPEPDNTTISDDFLFGIGMMDLWGNVCTPLDGCENPKTYVESSFARLKRLNTDVVMITDFYQLDRTKKIATVNKGGAKTMTKEELATIVKKAHEQDLKVMLITNLYEKDHSRELLDFEEPTETEREELLSEWSRTIIKQVEKNTADYLIINPRDIGFFFTRPEDNEYVNQKYLEILPALRKRYHGKICLWGFQGTIDGFENQYDCVIVDQTINDLFKEVPENLDAITSTWKKYLNTIKYNTTTFILILMPSYDGAIRTGWIEPVGESYDENITPDYKEQALIYEGFFRALKDNPQIKGVISYGYWWNDKVYPNTLPLFRNDLSHSIRDKDAENVFYQWSLKAHS